MNAEIEKLITAKNDVFKNHLKNNRNRYYTYKYKALQWILEKLIESSKQSYHKRVSEKLSSVSTSSKCYSSALKRMLNEKENPVIPPLFHNNNFISNFKEKSELFNEHFSEQCSLIQNKSAIPSVFTPRTHNLLSSLQFTADDIKSIINKLDPNKARRHMISIRMIKLCGDAIYKPLEVIIKSCLNQDIFTPEWKKANIVPVYKKGGHQCVKNYRRVSLLPVFNKIFERLIYNAMFKHFLDSNLISSNQSGFKPITHDNLKGFDDGFETRGVFLDISKAFDKVWHERHICKLRRNGICGNLLQLLISFLDSRK